MSYTLYPIRKQRLQRSYLAVPGSNPTMIDRAHKSAADYVFLDCEDAVAPPDKEQARKNIIQALNDLDWKAAGKSVSVRINGLDTHYMYRDVVDIVEQAGSKLDTILVPKVGVPADVYTVETIVSQIEVAKGLPHKIGMEALIETPLGMANVEAIASANSRLESMHFGVADYSAFNKARTVVIGGLNPDYPGDQWHFPLSRMTVSCRAFGLRPIDGPFGGIDDPEGYKAAAAAAPLSAWRASGRSIPRRSSSPTRSTRRQRRSFQGRAHPCRSQGSRSPGQGRGLARRQDDRRGLGKDGQPHPRYSRRHQGRRGRPREITSRKRQQFPQGD